MATSSSTAKTQAAAAAAATKAAATAAAASARSAAYAPSVASVIGATNSAISALSSMVNSKNPTAAQTKAAQQTSAAMQAASVAQVPIVTAANSSYDAAINTANTNYNTAMAAAAAIPDTPDAATQDAWAILSGSIGSWFGGDPVLTQQASDFIKQEMQNNIGPNQALVDMRQQQFYKTRFAGNITRVANGLNALTEADYIGLENTYTDYFTAYGQKALATQTQLATFIGNAVSPTEVKDRLDMAVVQVQQADPTVKATLKKFYPNITDANLLSYFLAPEDTLPVLQRQVQAADIGAAALQQGLSTSKIAAEGLAAYGTTYQQAQTGYGKIAEVLPAGQKLSQIYNAQTGIDYNQAEAEKQYLMNSGAATLEQQKLKDLESAQFQGRSGVVGANVAAGYSGSLGKSIQGSF